MEAKEHQKIKARHLRKKGLSLKEISSLLDVAKSSVSLWVKDIKLTKKQSIFLGHKAHTREVIQRRVATRNQNESEKRQLVMSAHKKSFPNNTLAVLGATLYWAEGTKSHKNRMFQFTNSDPLMIRAMMVFLKTICDVPADKFRAHIHLHAHLDKDVAQKYWSDISGIPVSQFYKTSQIWNRASKNTRDTLPYGTFSIQIGSTDLFLKMLAWIEAINEKIITQAT